MIAYQCSIDGITDQQLSGFFVGWPDPPSPAKHLALLRGSAEVVLAIDDQTQRVIGFITALADGVLSASIPLLEVLPDYQRRGIGTRLVHQMLDRLKDLYMIDLQCDPELVAFYESFGMTTGIGMRIRRRR